MLNIANVDESLKMYIRKELLVDDFFELMSLIRGRVINRFCSWIQRPSELKMEI